MVAQKYTAGKFWVALIYAVLTTASLLALPGWWGKGVGIALALVGSINVYLKNNYPIEDDHSGQ